MYFNRWDVCEAWYLALTHCHGGQWSREYARLCRLQRYFKPGAFFHVGSLSDNARAIYEAACERLLAEEAA